jgi:transcriptional regulator with XRE-family HTH domain
MERAQRPHRQGEARGSFGTMLARWRKARRMSQLDLALEAEVSSRHLSFVETDRSRPSREMVLRLAAALEIAPREENELLLAAGFAPHHRETPLEAREMASMLAALRIILRHHDPYGAVALDRCWNIVMASEAYAAGINALGLAGLAPVEPLTLTKTPRPNMLRLLCHPDGHRHHLANWPEVVRAVLQRVEREVGRSGAAEAERRALLAEVRAYPGIPEAADLAGAPPPLVIPIELRQPDGTITRLLSTMATLGTAEDITLRELRIEAFYAAEATAEETLT